MLASVPRLRTVRVGRHRPRNGGLQLASGHRHQHEQGDAVIDAYSELQQLAHFGQHGLRLLFELTSQELRHFPVLLEGRTMRTDDVWEWTQEFFSEKGPAVTAGVLAQAGDVASMGRYLRGALRHFLVDRARTTPRGAVRRKLEDLLAATPDFVRVPERTPGAGLWQLRGAPTTPFGGDLKLLVAAAYAVPGVEVVRWSGPRRAPLASDHSLAAIVQAVLTAAEGSMDVASLTAVLLQRFPAAAEHGDAVLDERVLEYAAAPYVERPDVAVDVAHRAEEVYEQLSPSQRALLPHLDGGATEQATVLGLGRSQTYVATSQLRALLIHLVPDDELRAGVVSAVQQSCLAAERGLADKTRRLGVNQSAATPARIPGRSTP